MPKGKTAGALARSIAVRAQEFCQGGCSITVSQRSAPDQLDVIRLGRSRGCEAIWLGWLLWRALELDEPFGVLLPSSRETVVRVHFSKPWGEASERGQTD
jgi:hypothetical protein